MLINVVPMPLSKKELRAIKYNEYVETKQKNNETDIMKYCDWEFLDIDSSCNKRFGIERTSKLLYGIGDYPGLPEELKKLNDQASILAKKYHTGLASKNEVKKFIENAYEVVKKANADAYFSSGTDKDDNMRMLTQIITAIQQEQSTYLANLNYDEGKKIFERKGDGDHYYAGDYYDSRFYYKEKEMSQFLISVGQEISDKEELGNFAKALEEPDDFFYKCTFNIDSQCDLKDKSLEPPKGFVYVNGCNGMITISGVDFDSKLDTISDERLKMIPDNYKRFLSNFNFLPIKWLDYMMQSIKDDKPRLYQQTKINIAYESYFKYR